MAIKQVGGQSVYVIDVDVPKVTDSRGKGYGTLVSDLRWKLWEEVQASQLQQMKFEQLSRQAQLDVLEQKQRDISRAIRDANELKSQIKADVITKGVTPARGYVETTTEPALSRFTGKPTGELIKKTKVRTPMGEVAGAEPVVETPESVAARKDELDRYIEELEAQQVSLGQEFQRFTALPPTDILSRTREAFQTQIGEGGFGIARRPLRQLPRFDESAAVGRIQDTIAREEQALLDEAAIQKRNKINNRIAEVMAMGEEGEMTGALLADLKRQLDEPLSLEQERQVRDLARSRVAEQMGAEGAIPTGRAGFLMKEPPPYEPLLPREETPFPTGRFRDDFAVEGTSPTFSREIQIKSDLDRLPGGLSNPAAEGLLQELQDIRRAKRAEEESARALSPSAAAMSREVELEALGASEAEISAARIARERAMQAQAEEELARGRLPGQRGFTYPVEKIGDVRTTTFGRPGGIIDRMTAARLARQEEVPPPEPAPAPAPAPVEEFEFAPGTGTISSSEATEPLGAKVTTQSRRDLYAMKTIKKGLELAQKPKQLARVAKTATPENAPEYVKLVNQVYDLNSARPDKFKLTFDEISRTYKDDPKTRELAHSYLVAKDAVESNVTNPIA